MTIATYFQGKLRQNAPVASKQDPDDVERLSKHVKPSLKSAQAIGIVGFTSTAMLLNICGISSMSIALPSIGRDLNIDPTTLQWLVTAYALTSGCFLLLFGRLADIFGRKHVFIAGTVWLIAFTIGCGLAQNGITIILMRAFAGMGPAATIPASLGILAKAFPPSRARSVAFATFSAGAPIGSAFGNVLGGLMTQYAPISWRAIFYVMAGIACLTLIGAFLVFPADDELSDDRRVDWIGALLITSGLVLFTFCLGEGEIAPNGWKTAYIIALLIISVVLIAAFIAWEYHVENRTTLPPLMRLDLWTRGNGKFAAIQVIGFLAWSAFSSFAFWATLYYQNYLGLVPIQTMLRFLPMSVTGFLVNVVFALVVSHVSGQVLIMIGCTGTGMANLLFAIIKTGSPYWAYAFPASVVSVFGADFIFASSTLYGARVARGHEQSLAGGIFNTVTQIGTAFGMTITTIVYDKVVKMESARLGVLLNSEASNAPPAALLLGYRMAQWASFAFAMFALLVAAIFLRGIGIIGGPEPNQEHDEAQAPAGAIRRRSFDSPSEKAADSNPAMPAGDDAIPPTRENGVNTHVHQRPPSDASSLSAVTIVEESNISLVR